MMYELPTSLEVGGIDHPIRSDFRAALDVCAALTDPEFSNQEKAVALLTILYESPEEISDIEGALKKGAWFIDCGNNAPQKKRPIRLMDWEQDFPVIVGAVNRVAGCEVRALEYLHWWTFCGYYMELGDCAFAQIVSIRNKKAKGKKLEKWEREFYRENREKIDFRPGVTASDMEFIKQMTGK